jgi:SAM-dependent methyltransferase
MPYETRRKVASQAGQREYFSKETWIQRDVCGRRPFPFKDKEIDFVVCSHTLEDIRDPVFVCSEICRVGKRGYIEVPSKLAELSLGIGSRRYAGHYHHRWIVEIENNKISFLIKPHFIHNCWRYHFPYCYGKNLLKQQEKCLQWLFWEESFYYEEKVIVDYSILQDEIERFVMSQGLYPGYRYKIDKFKQMLKKLQDKLLKHQISAHI